MGMRYNEEDRWDVIASLPIDVQATVLLAIAKVETHFGQVDFCLKISEEPRLANGTLACCMVETNEIVLSREFFVDTSMPVLESIVEQSIQLNYHPDIKLKAVGVVAHELCHAVWNMIVEKGISLEEEVLDVYHRWVNWKKMNHQFYSSAYANTNVCEFWAEMLTMAICGESDEFSDELMTMAKRYMFQ